MENFNAILNHYWRQFLKIGKKQRVIIVSILAISFILGLLLPIAISNLSTKPPAKATPTITPIPLPASVVLTADKKEVKVGATFSATINIDSPDQGVEAADFVVNFDPKYLNVATISAGNYFGIYPIKKIEKDQVKISGIANLVNDKFIIPIGRGTIGSIVFQSLVATPSTQISFDREKTIVASGGKNILGKVADLQISIK